MPAKPKSTDKSWHFSLVKYLLIAIAIFVPLYPKFPLFFLPGSSVAVRVEDILIFSLSLVLLVKYKFFFRLRHTLIGKMFALYVFVGFLAVLNSVFITKMAPPSLSLLHYLRRLEYAIPFFAAFYLAANTKVLRFFVDTIWPVAFLIFLYALAQLAHFIPVISTQNEEFSKGIAMTLQPGVNIPSTFAGHYDLATYLVCILSLLTAFFTQAKTLTKLIFGILWLCLFWLLLQTGHRISFAALLFVIPFLLIITHKLKLIPIFIIIVVIGLANAPRLTGRFGNVFRIIQFSQSQSYILVKPIIAAESAPTPSLRPLQQDRSTSIRLDVEWPRALRAFAKSPFLGTGYASITLATDNDYLRAIGETGALGLISFLGLLIIIIADTLFLLRHSLGLTHTYALGMLGFILSMCMIATFIDVFEASKTATLFWLYTGFISGSRYHAQKN